MATGEAETSTDKAGWLWKRSRSGFRWNRRWILASKGELQVRNHPDGKAKQVIPLEFGSVNLRGVSGGKWRFEVETSLSSRYVFAADSSFAANEWTQNLHWQMSPAQPRRAPPKSPLSAPAQPHDGVATPDTDNAVLEPAEAAWNESYQHIMEMDEHSFNMSVAKARSLNQLNSEFVATASRLGKTIVEEFTLPPHLKSIQPLDRHDLSPEDETFVSDGIAFQFMHDCDSSATGDETKKKMATHDLHGIIAYANASVAAAKGLHTFLCCIIDLYGLRLFAQALPPVYDDSRLAFGLADGVLTVEPDAEELLEQAASSLNLRAHDVSVNDMDGASSVRIHTSASALMHRGEDGRLYISNVSTALPLDENPSFPGASNELIAITRRLRREFVASYRRPLSSDAIALSVKHGADAEAASAEVIRASRHLVGKVIPDFVKQLNLLRFVPLDSVHMTNLMHRHGVNVRYLGAIAEQTLMPHVREMAICEMVARACKVLLGERLRTLIRGFSTSRRGDAGDYDSAVDAKLRSLVRSLVQQCNEGIIELFNLVMGNDLHARRFWHDVLSERVRNKFGYTLGQEEGSRLHRPLLLAALQHHCGVKIDDRGGVAEKLTLTNLLNVSGRTKFVTIDSLKCDEFPMNADEYLENGEFDMAIQAYQLRLDVMLPSGQDSSQVHHTLNQLCQAHLCRGDLKAARESARKALECGSGSAAHTAITFAHLVSVYRAQQQEQLANDAFRLAISRLRRLYGPHAPQILQLFDEVGSRHFEAGESQLAELQFKQAIELALTALGKSHPVTAHFYTRLGNVYHLENCFDRAKDAHEKACLIYEGLYGPASLDVARSCFYLSDIMSFKGDLVSARYYNQRALQIRLQLLGEHHPLTLDSYHQVAWQAHRREDSAEAIPYFEKLLVHYKSTQEPSPQDLDDIRKVTRAVIRLQMRALPMDQVAFLDKLYQESQGRLENRGALTRLVIRKLYDESPSAYVKDLLQKSWRGVNGPGYSEAAPELAVLLKLMETGGEDDGENDSVLSAEAGKEDGLADSESHPALISYAVEKPDYKTAPPKADEGENQGASANKQPYSMVNYRPSTIVKS